jgi:hypothetical protein
MSEDLLSKLQSLEADYPGQPPVVQQADLREINHIRSRLGLPPVDARLNVIAADVKDVEETTQPEPVEVPDRTEAREIYQAYLKKIEELEVHRAYADQVAQATAGHGQTPVRPLATLGTDGGPLLCDHCGKPIVLEGGRFHGVAADAAWKQNPRGNWSSWILGGMVVEIQTNGTLRIYHGYPGRGDNQCCNVASREDEEARAAFDSSVGFEKTNMILAFIEQEFPHWTREEHRDLLNKILNTLYTYDPGIGVNRPGGEGREQGESGGRLKKRKREEVLD